MWVRLLCQEDPLEEGIATDCSILAWRIPWTEEPGWLRSIALQTFRLGTTEVTKQQQQRGIFDHFVISNRVYNTAFP